MDYDDKHNEVLENLARKRARKRETLLEPGLGGLFWWPVLAFNCGRAVVRRSQVEIKVAIKLRKEAFWAWLSGEAMEKDFWLASKSFWQTIRWLWKGKQGSA